MLHHRPMKGGPVALAPSPLTETSQVQLLVRARFSILERADHGTPLVHAVEIGLT